MVCSFLASVVTTIFSMVRLPVPVRLKVTSVALPVQLVPESVPVEASKSKLPDFMVTSIFVIARPSAALNFKPPTALALA